MPFAVITNLINRLSWLRRNLNLGDALCQLQTAARITHIEAELQRLQIEC